MRNHPDQLYHDFTTNVVMRATIVIASIVWLLFAPSMLRAQSNSDGSWKGCQSSDADKRLVTCTAIINANGFGSTSRLAEALDGRCWAYNTKAQFALAAADCKTAIALRPNYFYAYNNLGTAYLGVNDYASAIEALNKAIILKPDFFWSRVNRAKAYAAINNTEAAITDYEYALILDPNNGEIKLALNDLRTRATAKTDVEAPAGSQKLTEIAATGFVISNDGHLVTNNHVVSECVGDVHGNLTGQSATKLRVVSTDATNDLALLQATRTFKDVATIRANAVHSGDAIVAIGFPLHGLLTSDFTVTTGIISSLAVLFNDTRFLQISAPVQPGNSGGPLLDTGGNIVGVVTEKLNALKVAKATGDIPENINFAIKTSALRDFLDNSVVPYRTSETKSEIKTAEITAAARAYTMLISCMARDVASEKKK
jgi:S1-C subfamily serine protease